MLCGLIDRTNMEEKMVTITEKEYKELIEDSNFLRALREVGIDNWEGYSEALKFDEAMENYQDYYDEEEEEEEER